MSVTIPTFGRKPGTDVVFIINGGWYTYPAGSSQDVPIGVAELINNYYALHPEEEIPSGGGGGGANQAVVTLDIYTNNNIYLQCVYDYDADGSPTFPFTHEFGVYVMNGNEDEEPYTIQVYKESATEFGSGTVILPLMGDTHSYCMYGNLQNITVTLSGAVTDNPIEDFHVFTITGDCTITFR